MNTNGSHYKERVTRYNRYAANAIAERESHRAEEARLKAIKKRNTKIAQEKVRKKIRDTLFLTEAEEFAEDVTNKLEEIYKAHPTPHYMITFALEYLKDHGVDVESCIWGCSIKRLRTEIEILTDPRLYK